MNRCDIEKIFAYIDKSIAEKKNEIEYLGERWTVAQVMYLVGAINTYVDIREVLYRELDNKASIESEDA